MQTKYIVYRVSIYSTCK